jgi:hypothetical protein
MPPLSVVTFSSDSASFNENTARGAKTECGSIGINTEGELCFAAQIFWPENLRKVPEMGSRTTTLELIGLLLPFLHNGTQFGKGEACAPESGQHRLLLCLA